MPLLYECDELSALKCVGEWGKDEGGRGKQSLMDNVRGNHDSISMQRSNESGLTHMSFAALSYESSLNMILKYHYSLTSTNWSPTELYLDFAAEVPYYKGPVLVVSTRNGTHPWKNAPLETHCHAFRRLVIVLSKRIQKWLLYYFRFLFQNPYLLLQHKKVGAVFCTSIDFCQHAWIRLQEQGFVVLCTLLWYLISFRCIMDNCLI